MASDQKFADFVAEQIQRVGTISTKRLFGEYGIYADDKMFGVICDNKLFVKQTQAGRDFIGNPVEAPAYKGAKPGFLIEEKIEDKDWLSQLVRVTLKELPAPKAKKK